MLCENIYCYIYWRSCAQRLLLCSEFVSLWKSSKCFSKPPTLIFLLKFLENTHPAVFACTLSSLYIKKEASVISCFPPILDALKAPEFGGCIPVLGQGSTGGANSQQS